MPQPETMRTFIAAPLSDGVISALDQLQRKLKRSSPEGVVRWVKPSSIHITLFFLGDILPERRAPIEEALSLIARHASPFDFEVHGLGAFPNMRRPNVVWVGVNDSSGGLTVLHDAVNEAMANLGFKPDERRFSPHLTLGRVRRQASRDDRDALVNVLDGIDVGDLGSVRVERIIFFQSVLRPTGAEYSPLATFPLG